jgi:hypothetical protein
MFTIKLSHKMSMFRCGVSIFAADMMMAGSGSNKNRLLMESIFFLAAKY